MAVAMAGASLTEFFFFFLRLVGILDPQWLWFFASESVGIVELCSYINRSSTYEAGHTRLIAVDMYT